MLRAECLNTKEIKMLSSKTKRVFSISFVLVMFIFISTAYSQVHVWQRWEQSLTTSKSYTNPYADVTLSVTYSGPGGRTINTFGFWDGGSTFKIRCAFPVPGIWNWSTTCSDTTDTALHNKSGSVNVTSYSGSNPLYIHGFLKISSDGRNIIYDDGAPFLWMGDTCWTASTSVSQSEWQTYINNRIAKHFTLVQVLCSVNTNYMRAYDTSGNMPFIGSGITKWNPSFWQGYEQKIEYANQQGIVMFIVGSYNPLGADQLPSSSYAQRFGRNLAARLFGNFVIFSPALDLSAEKAKVSLCDDVGNAINKVTSVHLITQHPGTPWRCAKNTVAETFFGRSYLDFSANQTGHNAGDLNWCYGNAINWNLSLYNRTPNKPVINIEAFYDNVVRGISRCADKDARGLGYLSWLSDSLGYTYGEGEIAVDSVNFSDWIPAMNDNSAFQMKYMHDFFNSIQWWTLRPAHSLIQNQATENTKKMALAKSNTGGLAVAYLPDNNSIQINMGRFPAGMTGKWFNPTNNQYTDIAGTIPNSGTYTFNRPSTGDWLLLLNSK